ncbi:Flp pilus assembly protein CpaB [Nocardioides terrae]|uniref:Flp pilus assembly protein CpaB n=1 Tax=Nocardioides terrae TaxID=574651 RepID=A0A1I1I694_9ACTN|nr:SAF domain-containing protein [Nocardioides terrae]SFC31949.1 Flp pilus assembly protein CpaB [Nocardioides terrae]
MPRPLPGRVLSGVRRRLLAHRRLLAGLLTAVAVAAGLRAVAPPGPETVALTVAAHDLAAGSTVAAADLTTTDVPPAAVPDGALADAAGAVLAAPLRRGEPITDARLVGPALTAAHPDLTALPVRLPDGAMAAMLRPGDRIDLYAVATAGDAAAASGEATRVAAGVLVLAVPPQEESASTASAGLSGRLIVIGVADPAVARVTDASARSFLTYAFVH